MPDGDTKRFERGLHDTKPGLKLRLAIHEQAVAVAKIEAFLSLGPRHRAALESWRRAYIRACDNGTKAIEELWRAHQWPSEAAAALSFEYAPPRASRPPRSRY